MLDWNERRLPFLSNAHRVGQDTFVYTASMLMTALASKSTIQRDATGKERKFTDEEREIRDSFDRLLDRLERFEIFIEEGLISYDELRPYLAYWMQLIGNKKFGRKRPEYIERLWIYIDEYGFRGVQLLSARFGYRIRPGQDDLDVVDQEVVH
jgi:hypothetical protein